MKQITTQQVTVQEAAGLLNVSPDTIRRWDRKKLLTSKRSERNYRLFDLEELRRIQNKYQGKADNTKFCILKSKPTKFTVIELFSGCGGLALGLKNAGFNTQLLVEINRDAVNTLQYNLPDCNIIHDDIAKVDFSLYRDKIDVVAGGPPCQAFSYAGLGKGFDDIRGTLFFEFARCIQQIQPKIALIENVRGLIKHDQGKTLSTILNTLDNLGYKFNYQLLRAQFLDVPQKRERVVIIATRKNLDIEILFPKEKDYTISLRKALKNCPSSIGAKYPPRKKEIMDLVPPGGYWRDLPLEIQQEYMKKR